MRFDLEAGRDIAIPEMRERGEHRLLRRHDGFVAIEEERHMNVHPPFSGFRIADVRQCLGKIRIPGHRAVTVSLCDLTDSSKGLGFVRDALAANLVLWQRDFEPVADM